MKAETLPNRILAADLLWIPCALALERALRLHGKAAGASLPASRFAGFAIAVMLAWVLLSESMELDGFRGGWRPARVVSSVVLATGLLLGLTLAIEAAAGRRLPRISLAIFEVLLVKGFLLIRWLALQHILRRHRGGRLRRVVILGSGRLAAELAGKLNGHPELFCQVVGFLWPGSESPQARIPLDPAPASSTVSSLELLGLLRQKKIDDVVIADPPVSREVLTLVGLCREHSIRVSLVPQPYELYLSRPSLVELGGLPLLQLGEVAAPAKREISRRTLDLVLGTALLAATSPVIGLCAALVRIRTGKAFRWEQRVGWRGNCFSMLRLNIDRNPVPDRRLDRVLWQLSLSELPQLWNVLRGEMSLVGPRPESPERVHLYSSWQQQRLAIKPGMTGLAQVHGLREQHSSEDKTRYDLQYMLQASVLQDLALIIETAWTLAGRTALAPQTLFRRNPSALVSPLPRSFASSPSYPEILQHAHWTQPGSD